MESTSSQIEEARSKRSEMLMTSQDQNLEYDELLKNRLNVTAGNLLQIEETNSANRETPISSLLKQQISVISQEPYETHIQENERVFRNEQLKGILLPQISNLQEAHTGGVSPNTSWLQKHLKARTSGLTLTQDFHFESNSGEDEISYKQKSLIENKKRAKRNKLKLAHNLMVLNQIVPPLSHRKINTALNVRNLVPEQSESSRGKASDSERYGGGDLSNIVEMRPIETAEENRFSLNRAGNYNPKDSVGVKQHIPSMRCLLLLHFLFFIHG